MKTKYTLFRCSEMFCMQDSATGKQTSLRTKDETEAKSLLEARNAVQRQSIADLEKALVKLRRRNKMITKPMTFPVRWLNWKFQLI